MLRFYGMLAFLLLIFVMPMTSSNAQDKTAETAETGQTSGQNLLFETMFDEGGQSLIERLYPRAEKKLRAALREAELFRMGGAVALEAAAKYSDIISGAISSAPGGEHFELSLTIDRRN